tara:strand:- start:1353 stop:2423 length:1071 start_codon:yes stop_codon:yes gene_type:complete
MKDFDYIIIGGGCAGLSLAYELQIHKKLENKTLAIIEPRKEYKKDKTWSFWKVASHNFDDCIEKNWINFSINISSNTNYLKCSQYPYQSINSGKFYKKINDELKENKNIKFFKDINEISTKNSFIFNSVPLPIKPEENRLWQHFCGIEIETKNNIFDDSIINLMDFDCEQKNSVHFFYTLPYSKNRALIETTWISKMSDEEKDYDSQLKSYIEDSLNIKNYNIIYKEVGAIPLFYPSNSNKSNKIDIGTAGGMTRLSTGYTFLNIQEHSKYLRENIDKIYNLKKFEIDKKYQFLDEIFLKVLKKNSQKMPYIFFKLFRCSPSTVIKFLSNKSNYFEDLAIILKMPKWLFINALFRK